MTINGQWTMDNGQRAMDSIHCVSHSAFVISHLSFRIFLFFLFPFSFFLVSEANGQDALFQQAAKHYEQKEYIAAIQKYEQIYTQGFVNPELLYNLGNAHFREGHLGQAIQFYHKALEQSPHNAQILHSLSIAEKRISDPIPQIPTPIWETAWQWIVQKLGDFGLFMLGWSLFFVVCGLLAHWIWAKTATDSQIAWRRRALMVLVPLSALFLFAAFRASLQLMDVKPKQAVLLKDRFELRSAANTASTAVRVLPEGTVLTYLNDASNAEWRFVALPNGEKGWVRKNVLGEI